jgi:membrane protein DedA with SNARE-associated domain
LPQHQEIVRWLAFVERHGYALLFFWVLAEQSAIPIPSAPMLLAAGALIRLGRLHPLLSIGCCLAGALLADVIWFAIGRRKGRRVLNLICRISLEPDSCVRQTENAFVKYGLGSLLVSKFIPGLNTIAAPLAGSSKTSFHRFAAYDGAGALIWSGSYLIAGYLFGEQLEKLLAFAERLGSNLALLAGALLALWIGWKFWQRRRFLNGLKVARITPEELRERLNAGEDLFIIDLRHGLANEPEVIPGAVRISSEELVSRARELPRDREIILFCS